MAAELNTPHRWRPAFERPRGGAYAVAKEDGDFFVGFDVTESAATISDTALPTDTVYAETRAEKSGGKNLLASIRTVS